MRVVRVTRTRCQTEHLPFHCVPCGFEGTAVVEGVGLGSGGPGLLVGARSRHPAAPRHAARQAHARALRAASHNARLTLALARCPRCRRWDRSAWVLQSARLASVTLGGVLAAWGLGGLLYGLGPDPIVLWIFVLSGIGTGAVLCWTESWKLTTVEQRVLFRAPLPGGPERLGTRSTQAPPPPTTARRHAPVRHA